MCEESSRSKNLGASRACYVVIVNIAVVVVVVNVNVVVVRKRRGTEILI